MNRPLAAAASTEQFNDDEELELLGDTPNDSNAASAGDTFASFLRSEEMLLLQLFVPYELANIVLAEVGMLKVAHFNDLNAQKSANEKQYAAELRRCHEMKRICALLAAEVAKNHAAVAAEADFSSASSPIGVAAATVASPAVKTQPMYRFANSVKEFAELEARLAAAERKVSLVSANVHELTAQIAFLRDQRDILRCVCALLDDSRTLLDEIGSLAASPLSSTAAAAAAVSDVGIVAGSIGAEKILLLERLVLKLLRGNAILKRVPMISDGRTAFVAFVYGADVAERVQIACRALGATMLREGGGGGGGGGIGGTLLHGAHHEAYADCCSQLERLCVLRADTARVRLAELAAVSTQLNVWRLTIAREERIFHTLNRFKDGINCLIGEAWVPRAEVKRFDRCLRRIGRTSQSSLSSSSSMKPFFVIVAANGATPPTFHRTNAVTSGFQALMDAYGVGRYQELNPAAFSVVTFPFLFAVMFGDFGHGCMLLMAAALLVFYERPLLACKRAMNDEIFRMLFAGRYILLLMGIFSLFTGVVYNDAFSRPLRLFDSGWHFFRRVPHKTPVPVLKRVYPVGIDTVWVQASNSLTFLNAYKMKQAVLMGLAQMYFGIFLGAANHVHFKRHAALWYETAPQLLFLTAIFGYLGFLIVFKWVFAPKAAASILTTMIDMVLTPFSFDARLQLFRGQHRVQIFLLAVALLCVIWLLFAKPLYMRRLRRLRNQSYTALDVGAAAASGSPTASVDSALHGEEADAQGCDAFITQAIHTIEFALGTVSNTASYLRLWALSLAHSQLSEVLWTMVIRNTASSGVVIAVLGFALWLFLTVFILVVMEGLSAFLHSLRLHWVEFNGRFFVGEGKPFLPLTFEDCDGDDCN